MLLSPFAWACLGVMASQLAGVAVLVYVSNPFVGVAMLVTSGAAGVGSVVWGMSHAYEMGWDDSAANNNDNNEDAV